MWKHIVFRVPHFCDVNHATELFKATEMTEMEILNKL